MKNNTKKALIITGILLIGLVIATIYHISQDFDSVSNSDECSDEFYNILDNALIEKDISVCFDDRLTYMTGSSDIKAGCKYRNKVYGSKFFKEQCIMKFVEQYNDTKYCNKLKEWQEIPLRDGIYSLKDKCLSIK